VIGDWSLPPLFEAAGGGEEWEAVGDPTHPLKAPFALFANFARDKE
jgi:hypothetical protein